MVTRTKESALSQRSLIFAFAVPSSTLETVAFLSWFLIDATFVTSAVCVACRGRRGIVASRISSIFVVGLLCLWWLCVQFPDDQQQVTAYWSGIILQFPVGWGLLYYLCKSDDLKNHSLMIWYGS